MYNNLYTKSSKDNVK